jgi:hypothetical protein
VKTEKIYFFLACLKKKYICSVEHKNKRNETNQAHYRVAIGRLGNHGAVTEFGRHG